MGNEPTKEEIHHQELVDAELATECYLQDGHGGIDEPVVVWSTRCALPGNMANYMEKQQAWANQIAKMCLASGPASIAQTRPPPIPATPLLMSNGGPRSTPSAGTFP